MPASRFDFGTPITATTTTPSGGRRLSGRFTRVGVATYQRADGSSSRELRSREEVFHPDSLASLRGAAVTDLHPEGEEMVTPSNWSTLAKGVALEGRPVDPYIEGQVDVNDGAVIALIDAGERKEISMGYSCDVDETPGVYEGQPYDRVQRNIRYNHVAIGPDGWGRMGPAVSLRLDSSAILLHEHQQTDTVPVMANTAKHRVDGIEYEAGTEAHIAAVDKHTKKLSDDLFVANEKFASEKKRADAAEQRATPAELHKRADARAKLLTFARRKDMLGPDYLRKDEDAAAAVDDDAIIRAILKKVGVQGVENMSHEMLMGALVAAMGMAPEAPAAPAEAPAPPIEGDSGQALDSALATRGKLRAVKDSDDEDPVTKAERTAREKRANAWRYKA